MRLKTTAAILTVLSLLLSTFSAAARDGDTLAPIAIDVPQLVTYPDTFLSENDFTAIEQRVNEARNSGVPLAVRIVDLSVDTPPAISQLSDIDLDQPLTSLRVEQITQTWIDFEPVETSPGADDGFLLLVLVPEDRTQTQALWRIGTNALPLNGLTEQNIASTVPTMNTQLAQGLVANGVFQGLLEFGSFIQFGVPERHERTTLQDALHTAMIPLAIMTAMAGLAIPVLAWRLRQRSSGDTFPDALITPWEAAAIHLGRVTPAVTTAMLLDAIHDGSAAPTQGGGLLLQTEAGNPGVESVRAFATNEGLVSAETMQEIESITQPVRCEMEDHLAEIGAFTDTARTDRTWMLLVMGFTVFLMALGMVPIVVSMSALGVYGIAIALLGIAWGWWWLSSRSYTTDAGVEMLSDWLDSASPEDRNRFDLAVHQTFLIEQTGGPLTSTQMKLVRHLRGLGAH